MTNYNPLPVTFSHGQGMYLWDETGKQYLDALSGIAVCNLGHAHPAITQVIQDQATKLLHTSNIYHIAHQQALAADLTRIAHMETAFFCNSGAEANETAIKLARLYGHKQHIENPAIIVMEQAFHGRTLATLSASGSRKVQAGFEPLVVGFMRAPYNDLSALETIAHNSHNVVAVLVEPIQGEGGINVPAENYLSELRQLCDKYNWLLMLDEVQTGAGRTGAFYAYQHTSILPDVVTSAKGLGNGIPIGACLARGKAATLFQPGNHGSTFGGNPFCCRVAHTVLKVIEQENLLAHATNMGARLLQELQSALAGIDQVIEVRGKGLMIGIELRHPCRELLTAGLAAGLLFNVTAERVIRLVPPLIIEPHHITELVDKLSTVIKNFRP